MKYEKRIGFTCAYTPQPMIHAAGFTPFRVLPVGDWQDQAGQILHDNLCPHVKRILDRAMAADLPPLEGMVFVNSCDAMRRLADAWKRVRPDEPVIFLDLPVASDKVSVEYFAKELQRFQGFLKSVIGDPVTSARLEESLGLYNRLALQLASIKGRISEGTLPGGSAEMQRIYNRAATSPWEETLEQLDRILKQPRNEKTEQKSVPLFLFGNVLADPEAFELVESCGGRVADEDFCTGSRMFSPMAENDSGDCITHLAEGLLTRPLCARTFDPGMPGGIAHEIVERAKECGAAGVIGHTMKFCDPYLDRFPFIRRALKEAGLPFLLLEGDCTLRSIGQQHTRVEAFIEMLR